MTVDGIINLTNTYEFITSLKDKGTKDLQKLFDEAIQSIHHQNKEIQERNDKIPWYIHVLDFITCGAFSLLEETVSLKKVLNNIDQIRHAILSVPHIEQTWRADYNDIKKRFDSSKTIQAGFKQFIKNRRHASRNIQRGFKGFLQKQEEKNARPAISIQRKWRAHFRNKLKNSHQTYEAWRANAILQKYPDPLEAARKFRDTYRSTHYAFTHGQSNINAVNAVAINGLVKKFQPQHSHPLSLNFRVPGSIPFNKNSADYLAKNRSFKDDLVQISAQIMSVDAYLHSKIYAESAYFYYSNNSNIRISYLPLEPVVYLVQDNILAQKFIQKITSIGLEYHPKSKQGNLYTILVPKKIQENPNTQVAYAAYGYGIPHENNSIEFLESHQHDICQNFTQYRLVVSALNQSPGIRVYRQNHLTQQDNALILNRITIEVELLYTYYILNSLRRAITESQFTEAIDTLKKHSDQIDSESLNYVLNNARNFLSDEQYNKIKSIKK